MRVLITGGYSGIGFEVAKRISLYHKVYIGIHREEELKYANKKAKFTNNKVHGIDCILLTKKI